MNFEVTILCRCKIRIPIEAAPDTTMNDLGEKAIQEIISSKYPSEDYTYTITREDILNVEEISFRPKR